MKKIVAIFIPLYFLTFSGCGDGTSIITPVVKRDDGSSRLNINLSGSLQNPAYSPDGTSIVFTRFRDGYNQGASDLYIFNLKTKRINVLVSNGDSNINLPGSIWNAASNHIVFSSERQTHDEIFSIAATGTSGEETQITDRADTQAFEPSFSPDGEWIVFESHPLDDENHSVVTTYKVDGSEAYTELTNATENAKQPNWSPQGDRILYQKEQSGKWAIWAMQTDGTNSMMITNPNESNTDAVFSFDGQWIIYSSENSDVDLANIYKIPSYGGLTARLTTFKGYDGAPSISPDGKSIVFESSDDAPDNSEGTALWLKEL